MAIGSNDENIVLGISYDGDSTKAANKDLESLERKADQAADAMSKSFDRAGVSLSATQRTAKQMERTLESLRGRVSQAQSGGDPVAKLQSERDAVIKRLSGDAGRIQEAESLFANLIQIERKNQEQLKRERVAAAQQAAEQERAIRIAEANRTFDALIDTETKRRAQMRKAAVDETRRLDKESRGLQIEATTDRLEKIKLRRADRLADAAGNPQEQARIVQSFQPLIVAESARRSNEFATALARVRKEAAETAEAQKRLANSGQDIEQAMFGAGVKATGFLAALELVKKGLFFLSDSAQYAGKVELLGVALEAVAKEGKITTESTAVLVQRMEKIGITTETARDSLTRLIGAQVDYTKIVELSSAAQNVGRSRNVATAEAMERMIQAITTLQPEVLKQIGINVSLENELQRFSQETGRAVNSIQQWEKTTILMNAVLRQAAPYANVYGKAIGTAAGQALSFSRYIDQLKLKLGQELNPVYEAAVAVTNAFLKNTDRAATSVKLLFSGVFILSDAIGKLQAAYQSLKPVQKQKNEDFAVFARDLAERKRQETLARAVPASLRQGGDSFNTKAQIIKLQRELDGLSLQAEEESVKIRARAAAEQSGGIAGIYEEQSQKLRELSRAFHDGNIVDIQLTEKTTANIQIATRLRVAAELRKIDKQIISDRLEVEDLVSKNEQTNLRARFEYGDAELKGYLLRGLIAQRDYEDQVLALRRETIDKVAALETQDVARRLNEDLKRIREDAKRSGLPQDRLQKQISNRADQAQEQFAQIARAATDQNERSTQEVANSRAKAEFDLLKETRGMREDAARSELQAQLAILENQKDARLASVDAVNKRSLSAQLQVEQQRLAIEAEYIQKRLELELAMIDLRTKQSIAAARREADERGVDTQGAVFLDNIRAIEERSAQERKTVSDGVNSALEKASRESGRRQAELIRDEYQRTFDTIKRSADGLFDAMLQGSKSFTDALRRTLIAGLLTPVKNAFSNFVASLFAGFGGVGGGAAANGGAGGGGAFGGILGGIGALGRIGASATTPPFVPGTSGVSIGAQAAGAGSAFGLGGFGSPLGALRRLGSLGTRGGQFGNGFGGVGGGLALLGGGILGFDGLRRGGVAGTLETAAGGALIGAKLGGPLGALIGFGVGLGAGLLRGLFKTSTEKAIAEVKKVYGVTINKELAEQIVQIGKTSGGLAVAVRSTQVREMVELYAMATGQQIGIGSQVRPVSFVQTGGALYQQAQNINGQRFAFSSSVPTFGGSAQTIPGPTIIQLDGEATTALLEGRAISVIDSNPRIVANATQRAARSSYNRRETWAAYTEPNTVLA